MISNEYEKIPLGPGGELVVDTNFSSASKPCKYFRFTLGDKSVTISREELFGLLFLFADEKQQEDLIPVTQTTMRSISRLLTFTVQKDMRKGEKVSAFYQYFVPETVYEKLLISNPDKYRSGDATDNKLARDVNKIV